MLKQKLSKFISYKSYGAVLAMAAILAFNVLSIGLVSADQFEEQIKALEQQNSANRQVVSQLSAQASSYQDAISKLDVQISALRQAILDYQRQSDDLQRQIEVKQAELVHQKEILGENIKTMYLEGQISTLEILASSNNLSEFVDKQTYRNSVQNKVKTSVEKITEIKTELEQKQREVQSIIRDKENQHAQLDSALSEQNRLLSFTESQKAGYNQEIKTNQTKIAELRRAQAAANARLYGGGAIIQTSRCDIYPQDWCNAPMDSIVDSWGMYNRECVSWTAYRVAASGRYMPYWGGVGNANQWDDNARDAGIPVDGNPKAGDVAISNAGFYGHAMYVEAINGDGTIAVSQFNHDWNGTYSYVPSMPVGSLVFIHFP